MADKVGLGSGSVPPQNIPPAQADASKAASPAAVSGAESPSQYFYEVAQSGYEFLAKYAQAAAEAQKPKELKPEDAAAHFDQAEKEFQSTYKDAGTGPAAEAQAKSKIDAMQAAMPALMEGAKDPEVQAYLKEFQGGEAAEVKSGDAAGTDASQQWGAPAPKDPAKAKAAFEILSRLRALEQAKHQYYSKYHKGSQDDLARRSLEKQQKVEARLKEVGEELRSQPDSVEAQRLLVEIDRTIGDDFGLHWDLEAWKKAAQGLKDPAAKVEELNSLLKVWSELGDNRLGQGAAEMQAKLQSLKDEIVATLRDNPELISVDNKPVPNGAEHVRVMLDRIFPPPPSDTILQPELLSGLSLEGMENFARLSVEADAAMMSAMQKSQAGDAQGAKEDYLKALGAYAELRDEAAARAMDREIRKLLGRGDAPIEDYKMLGRIHAELKGSGLKLEAELKEEIASPEWMGFFLESSMKVTNRHLRGAESKTADGQDLAEILDVAENLIQAVKIRQEAGIANDDPVQLMEIDRLQLVMRKNADAKKLGSKERLELREKVVRLDVARFPEYVDALTRPIRGAWEPGLLDRIAHPERSGAIGVGIVAEDIGREMLEHLKAWEEDLDHSRLEPKEELDRRADMSAVLSLFYPLTKIGENPPLNQEQLTPLVRRNAEHLQALTSQVIAERFPMVARQPELLQAMGEDVSALSQEAVQRGDASFAALLRNPKGLEAFVAMSYKAYDLETRAKTLEAKVEAAKLKKMPEEKSAKWQAEALHLRMQAAELYSKRGGPPERVKTVLKPAMDFFEGVAADPQLSAAERAESLLDIAKLYQAVRLPEEAARVYEKIVAMERDRYLSGTVDEGLQTAATLAQGHRALLKEPPDYDAAKKFFQSLPGVEEAQRSYDAVVAYQRSQRLPKVLGALEAVAAEYAQKLEQRKGKAEAVKFRAEFKARAELFRDKLESGDYRAIEDLFATFGYVRHDAHQGRDFYKWAVGESDSIDWREFNEKSLSLLQTATNPEATDRDFAALGLEMGTYLGSAGDFDLFQGGAKDVAYFGAASQILDMMGNDRYVGTQAKSYRTGIANRSVIHETGVFLGNLSVVGAESLSEAGKSAALWLVPAGVGRLAGAGARLMGAGERLSILANVAASSLSGMLVESAWTGNWDAFSAKGLATTGTTTFISYFGYRHIARLSQKLGEAAKRSSTFGQRVAGQAAIGFSTRVMLEMGEFTAGGFFEAGMSFAQEGLGIQKVSELEQEASLILRIFSKVVKGGFEEKRENIGEGFAGRLIDYSTGGWLHAVEQKAQLKDRQADIEAAARGFGWDLDFNAARAWVEERRPVDGAKAGEKELAALLAMDPRRLEAVSKDPAKIAQAKEAAQKLYPDLDPNSWEAQLRVFQVLDYFEVKGKKGIAEQFAEFQKSAESLGIRSPEHLSAYYESAFRGLTPKQAKQAAKELAATPNLNDRLDVLVDAYVQPGAKLTDDLRDTMRAEVVLSLLEEAVASKKSPRALLERDVQAATPLPKAPEASPEVGPYRTQANFAGLPWTLGDIYEGFAKFLGVTTQKAAKEQGWKQLDAWVEATSRDPGPSSDPVPSEALAKAVAQGGKKPARAADTLVEGSGIFHPGLSEKLQLRFQRMGLDAGQISALAKQSAKFQKGLRSIAEGLLGKGALDTPQGQLLAAELLLKAVDFGAQGKDPAKALQYFENVAQDLGEAKPQLDAAAEKLFQARDVQQSPAAYSVKTTLFLKALQDAATGKKFAASLAAWTEPGLLGRIAEVLLEAEAAGVSTPQGRQRIAKKFIALLGAAGSPKALLGALYPAGPRPVENIIPFLPPQRSKAPTVKYPDQLAAARLGQPEAIAKLLGQEAMAEGMRQMEAALQDSAEPAQIFIRLPKGESREDAMVAISEKADALKLILEDFGGPGEVVFLTPTGRRVLVKVEVEGAAAMSPPPKPWFQEEDEAEADAYYDEVLRALQHDTDPSGHVPSKAEAAPPPDEKDLLHGPVRDRMAKALTDFLGMQVNRARMAEAFPDAAEVFRVFEEAGELIKRIERSDWGSKEWADLRKGLEALRPQIEAADALWVQSQSVKYYMSFLDTAFTPLLVRAQNAPAEVEIPLQAIQIPEWLDSPDFELGMLDDAARAREGKPPRFDAPAMVFQTTDAEAVAMLEAAVLKKAEALGLELAAKKPGKLEFRTPMGGGFEVKIEAAPRRVSLDSQADKIPLGPKSYLERSGDRWIFKNPGKESWFIGADARGVITGEPVLRDGDLLVSFDGQAVVLEDPVLRAKPAFRTGSGVSALKIPEHPFDKIPPPQELRDHGVQLGRNFEKIEVTYQARPGEKLLIRRPGQKDPIELKPLNEAASGGKSSKIRPVAVALQAGDVLEIHTVAVGKKNPVASFPFGTYGGLVGLPKLPSKKPILAGQLTAADREAVTLQDLPALDQVPERPQVVLKQEDSQVFLRPYQITDAILPGAKLGKAVKAEPVPGEKGRLLVTFELETLGVEDRETVTLPLSDTEAHRLGLVGPTGKLPPKGKIPVLQVATLRASELVAPPAPRPVAPLLPGRHPIAGPVAGFPKGADLKIVLQGESKVEIAGEFLLEGEGLRLRAASDQVQVFAETGREGPGGLNAVLSPKTPEGTSSQTGTMETKTWSLAQGDVVQVGDRFFAVKGKAENQELIPLAGDPRVISKQEWERRAKEPKAPTRAYLEVSFSPTELEISGARVDAGPDGALCLTQGKGFTVVDAKGQRLTVLQQEATALQAGDKLYYDEGLVTALPSKPVYLGEVVAGKDGKAKWKPAESNTAAIDREAVTDLDLPAVVSQAPQSSLAKLTPVKLDALAAMAAIEVGRKLAGFPLLGRTTFQEEPGRLTVSIGVPGRGYATELAENLAARLRKEHPQADVKIVQGKDGAVFVIARAEGSDRVIAFNLRFKAEASPAPEDMLAYAKQFEERHGEKFAALAKGDVKDTPESTFIALSSEYHAALRPREALQRLLEIGPKVRVAAPEMEGRLLELEAQLAKGSRADLAPDPELKAYLKAVEEMAVYEKTLREYEKGLEPPTLSDDEVEIVLDRPGLDFEEVVSAPIDREAVTEMDLPAIPPPAAPPWSGLLAGLHQIALQAVPYLPLMPVFVDAVLSQGLLGGGAQLSMAWFGKMKDKLKGLLPGGKKEEVVPAVVQETDSAKIASMPSPDDTLSPLKPGSYVWDAGLDMRYLPESTDVAVRHPDLTGEDLLALLRRDGQDLWVLPRSEVVQVLDASGRPLGLASGFDSQTGEKISQGYRVPEQAYLQVGDKLYARQGTEWVPLQQDPWSGRSLRQTGDLEFEIPVKGRSALDAALTPVAGPMPVPEIRAAAVVDPGAEKITVENLRLAVQDNLPDKPRRAAYAQNQPTFAYGSFAAHTDEGLGGKSENEDAYGVLPEYGVGIVADGMGGMGGMGGGDKASAVAVAKLAEIVKDPNWDGDLKQALIQAGRAVNQEVNPPSDSTKKAGTTAVVQRVVQKNGRTYAEIAHVGDAGALVLRPKPDGGFEVVFATREQSMVAEWRGMGALKNTMEMRWSPQAHVVSGGLGLRKDAKPEVATVELQPGDWTLLFSDGIGDNFSKDELSVLVQSSKTPEEARDRILAALRLKMERLQTASEQLAAGQDVFLVPVQEKGVDIEELEMLPIDGWQDYYLGEGGKVVGRAVQFKDAQGQVRTGVAVPWAEGRFAVRNAKGEMEYFQGEAVQGLDYFLPVDRYKADNISIHVYKHELLPAPAEALDALPTNPQLEEEWRIDDVLDETPQTLVSNIPPTQKMKPVQDVVPPPPTVKLAPVAEEIPPTYKLIQAVSAPKHPEESGTPASPILARVGNKEIDLSLAAKEPQVVYREGPVVVELSVDAIGRYLLKGRGFNWGSKPVIVEFEGRKFQLSRMKPSAPPLEVKSAPPPDAEKTHVAIAVGTSDFKTGLSESKGELAASDIPPGVEMELIVTPTALWDRDSDKNEVRVEDVLAEKPVSVGTLTREEAGGLTLQLRKELLPAYQVDVRDASMALKKGAKGSVYDPIALAEGDRIGIGPMGIMKFVVARDEQGRMVLRPDGIEQKVRVHLSASGIVSAKSEQPSPFKKMIQESMKDTAPEAPALPALSPEERLDLASNVSPKERLGIVRDDKVLSDPLSFQRYIDSTKRLLGPTLSEQLGFLLVDSSEGRAKIQKLREAVARRAGHSYPNVTKLREYAAEALLQEGIDISERAIRELGLGKSLSVVNLTLGEALLPQLYPNDVPMAMVSEERKAWALGDVGFSGLFHPQHPATLLPGTTLGEIRMHGYLAGNTGNMLVAGHQFLFKPYPGSFNPAKPIVQLEGQLFSFRQSVDVRAVFTFTSLANPKHQVVVEGPLGTDAKLAIEVARSSVKQTGKATALEDVIPLLLLENPQNIPVKLPLELRAFQILGWIAEQNEKTPQAYSMSEGVKDLVDKWGDPIDNNNTLVDMEFYDRYSLSLRAKDRSHAESLLKMVQDSYGAALDPKQVIGPEPFSDAKGQGLSFRLTLSQASGALSNGKMLEIKVYAPN